MRRPDIAGQNYRSNCSLGKDRQKLAECAEAAVFAYVHLVSYGVLSSDKARPRLNNSLPTRVIFAMPHYKLPISHVTTGLLLLGGNCSADVIVLLNPDQAIAVVSRREALMFLPLVADELAVSQKNNRRSFGFASG